MSQTTMSAAWLCLSNSLPPRLFKCFGEFRSKAKICHKRIYFEALTCFFLIGKISDKYGNNSQIICHNSNQ